MVTLYYEVLFAASLLLTTVYALMWHRHFDLNITLMFTLIPIANFGFAVVARSKNVEDAVVGNQIAYIGGCYLVLFIFFSVCSLCHIELKEWIRTLMLCISTVMFICMLTTREHYLFYRSVSFRPVGDAGGLAKEYGVLHSVFYVIIGMYFLMSFAATLIGFLRKKDVSNSIVFLLFLPELLAVISYTFGKAVSPKLDPLPLSYVFAQIMYLIIVHRVCLYDITETGIDSMVQSGQTGLVSFDFKQRYLGSNEAARAAMPGLAALAVDKPLPEQAELSEILRPWLTAFSKDGSGGQYQYSRDGRVYKVDVRNLFNGRRRRGCQLVLTDDTKNQEYISLLNRYNTGLQKEVAEKTAHIVEMHNQLILGMATMVESRDNSTGGHIRRTSELVRILIDEMRADPALHLTDAFCRNIIKAAPMHDLGKIAVDDAVLRKPGRFTDEEYRKMQSHAAEGARIVREILSGTDDEAFRVIAENVAHYHHERWDGSGYPEKLCGENIPLEARIMAIADVYDALVSKRVYKEPMSFEKADAIITEGMGRQFDPDLAVYYNRARPRFEAYYKTHEGC